MPFAKCKFYTESGEPVRGGCLKKGSGCAFIHPDDPNWAKARGHLSKPRDKGGDAGRPWDRGKRGAPQESNASATDTGSAWEGGGWGSGWDTGEAASASESKGQSSWGTSSPASASTNGGQGGWGASGWGDKTGSGTGSTGDNGWGSTGWGNNQNTDKTSGSGTGNSGWGSSGWGNNQNADKSGGSETGDNGWGSSGWGNNQNANKPSESETGSIGDSGWGSSGWGNNQSADRTVGSGTGSGWGSGLGGNKDADKIAEPAKGSTRNDGWGSGWGNNRDGDKNAGSTWGSARDDGGSGWGNDGNATTSRRVSQPMVVDGPAENVSGHGRAKGKAVIAPPRIRIPDNESRKAKSSGTNNEPLGHSKLGESRPSNFATTSTPMTALTPVAASTPTESIHGKRKRDATLDDRFVVFKEYVKAWERAVRAKFLLVEIEAKLDRWRRTRKSACYARIGEAGRDRLNGQRTELHKEHSAQMEKLTGAISSLMDFHAKLASTLDLVQRYNIGEETQKFISESKAFVDETRALLVARVLKEKDQRQPRQPSEADATSIDSLRSRMSHLEERFEQAQTELTLRQQRDIRPEVDEILTAKIQTLRAARREEMDRVASKPRPEIVIPPNALKDIEETAQQVNEMETKVPHTVEDIRVLLFRVDAMTKRVSQLEEEVSMNKETYRKQVESMAAQKEEAERQLDNKLQNIEGQFQQLVASQPPALAAQTPRTQDSQLMENLQPLLEAVLTKFYEVQIRPAVEAVQQLAINESDRHQEAAISLLWGRMKPAMSMVEGVSRWLDSHELGLTAPVEEDSMLVSG